MTPAHTKIAAYWIVLVGFAAVTWLVLSVIRSFVILEWISITHDPLGRSIYVFFVWLGAFRLMRDSQ